MPNRWREQSDLLRDFIQSQYRTHITTGPEIDSLLKRRRGSVLARHTILKADHIFNEEKAASMIKLSGSLNFRGSDLNIFGVAQPDCVGLYTVLTLLGSGPMNPERKSTFWVNTRDEPLIYINEVPFVLRDFNCPGDNIKAYSGISQARLEQMEARLKEDVLNEANENGGLVLVHDEEADGHIILCLVAIDSVKTSKEIFEDLNQKGYRVEYRRIPISHGFNPMEPFIDEFIHIFKTLPIEHSVVFNCSLGIGRTTFGMLVALLIRRSIVYEQTKSDPFTSGNVVVDNKRDILHLIYILEAALGKAIEQKTAIQWVLERDQIIENLTEALHGNYKCIMDLCRVLNDGMTCKKDVDEAINRCDSVLNLRESILTNRVRHSVKIQQGIDGATSSMERYFALITLSGYLRESLGVSFSNWVRSRTEIWNMFVGLRKLRNKLKLFLPIENLSVISKMAMGPKKNAEMAQMESNVIKTRAGSVLIPHTILKMDLWINEYRLPAVIEGAENFHQVVGFPVYGVAQPRFEGIRHIVASITENLSATDQICWINIREEPLVFIHGEPFVLRDSFGSLRNMRSYSGISAGRLEHMEFRLKEDILSEVHTYNSSILVHAEDGDGTVFPIWENITGPGDVLTISEVFQQLKASFPNLHYFRIPVTAEDAPEPVDFDFVMKIVCNFPLDRMHLVFNCQIGAGRSTTGTIMASQVLQWRRGTKLDSSLGNTEFSNEEHYYKAVHSILRAIRYGSESKYMLDTIVDSASAVVNIRKIIDECSEKAKAAIDAFERKRCLKKGTAALRRYCLLLLFQAYLNEHTAEEQELGIMETFAEFLSRHPELEKILSELEHSTSLEGLQASSQLRMGNEEGIAFTNEVAFVIKGRRGSVLAPLTILKYDHFPGCHKMSLPERLEGAPNFREVLMPIAEESNRLSIYGVAMPTASAIKDVLRRISAEPGGTRRVLWVSLREEPVAFINDRPYVLRVVKDPVANIEMTGIISERVESMEARLKTDILAELKQFDHNLLLHEEEMGKAGYEVVPVWERTEDDSVASPAEVYSHICSEGYLLSYVRIPITDEQAPIPSVIDLLFKLVWDNPAGTDVIFNCQMGRGRTTTGMIIATLIHLVRNNINVEFDDVSSPVSTKSENYQISVHFLNGEYKIILQLLSVLDHGRKSKMYADFAIDMCAHIQNLREAIFNFKAHVEQTNRSGNATPDSKKLKEIRNSGINYLVRYFYLIVFSEFLFQRVLHSMSQDKPPTEREFSSWLQERPEIINLVSDPYSLDFS